MKKHRMPLGIFSCVWLSLAPTVFGQAGRPGRMIREAIDDSKRVALVGNTRPEATTANDRGMVDDALPMEHLLLQLKRAPETEATLTKYIDQLHNPSSANFHKWLTPEQFAAQYSVAAEDVEAVTKWLTGKGFSIDGVVPSGLTVEFSGTAGQVRKAFGSEIHHLSVEGRMHIANMTDPKIPAALEPVVAGVVALHNFMPKQHLAQKKPDYTYLSGSSTYHALVPGDIATIYNIAPLWAAGYTGKGQSIMLVEDTYLYSTGDFTVFRKTFGLARPYPYGTLSQISPAGALTCANPGFQGSSSQPGYGDDGEAAIDVEWATAVAPNAAIILAACTDTTTVFGGLIALQNTLNGPAASLPSVVSVSYGESESFNGAAANLSYYNAYQQAVSEGVSIFVSSGDENAASSDEGSVASHGITVSGFATTPYNVAVGGLDFSYVALGADPSTFWSATNSNTYSSALSYIGEIPWNNSCAGTLVANYLGTSPAALCNSTLVTSRSGSLHALQNAVGGSGGPSGCATGTPANSGRVNGTCAGYTKPAWQSGIVGNPSDTVRDIPDVSLFASNGFWDAYYVVCWSNPDTSSTVGGGGTCTGAPSTWPGFGGTSVSSPIMAAIQTLVNQKTGSRWGNPNTVYYALAKGEFGAAGSTTCNSALGAGVAGNCIFYDVTQGDIDSVCRKSGGTAVNCFILGSSTYGILSTSTTVSQPAYPSTTGWDFATGIGSVNAYNLVMNWPVMVAPSNVPDSTSAGENQ